MDDSHGRPVNRLEIVEATLTPRTYAVGNALTAADVALYGALHPVFAQLPPAQYLATPALTRYFDHVQAQPAVRAAAAALAPHRIWRPPPPAYQNAPAYEAVVGDSVDWGRPPSFHEDGEYGVGRGRERSLSPEHSPEREHVPAAEAELARLASPSPTHPP